MGTRCLIKFKDPDLKNIAIYKHYDGYPRNTLPWLETFVKKFTESRADDYAYFIAALLRNSARPESIEKFGLDGSELTGWGLIVKKPKQKFDCWQEFEYLVDLTKGTVTVKEV